MEVGVLLLILIFHFNERVLPGFSSPWGQVEIQRAFPYLLSLILVVVLVFFYRGKKKKYQNFLSASPGKLMTQSSSPSPTS